MDKSTRNEIQRATQAARRLLEDAYREQLEGTYDTLLDGTIAEQPGSHLSERQKVTREKLVAAVAHKKSAGLKAQDAVDAYLREAAFTTLNRFVALKMLEARDLVQECVSKGEDSSGFKEFTALAPGLVAVEDKGYRLYIETLFDEIGQEVKVLFDRRDVASLLWPDRQTLLELLGILNAPGLASVWAEDETIGWVYQYFNGDEERTKMRAESQAPRNSRELAVRNQFFTPRYVVQFLTDNTLGRTWYEMMQGETKLADLDYLVRRPNEVFLAEDELAPESDADDSELSQEELLQQTVHVPFRAKKDPRDLRILDPACGSGHFLLYAFELLVSIYEEAWSDAEAAAFTETGTQLRADCSSVEDLRCAMPELILRQNLHGIDIDPRAAQIAALALWMRAQRAYNQFEIGGAERPSITKTNIVIAEPMPGDAELVEEFAANLKPAVLGDLFKKMVEEMKLAGELGSLLKIEESIAKAVKDAEDAHRQGSLFAGELEGQNFWETADEKIIAALAVFAESAAGSAGIRRKLFAGDAAQGVAFIELMRKRFDAVLMNPPFGDPTKLAKAKATSELELSGKDMGAAFVAFARSLLAPNGGIGALTSSTLWFKPTVESWRRTVFLNGASQLAVGAHLGGQVLDGAKVGACATVLSRPTRWATFLRALEPRGRDETILTALAGLASGSLTRDTFCADVSEFDKLASAPLAYWVSTELRRRLAALPKLEGNGAEVRQGTATADEFRFVRAWWEVETNLIGENRRWIPYAKGSEYSPFWDEVVWLLKWVGRAREIRAYPKSRPQGIERFGTAGVTYPARSYLGFNPRAFPVSCAFGHMGSVAFPLNTDASVLLGYLASRPLEYVLSFTTGALQGDLASYPNHYEVGQIQSLPWPSFDADQCNTLRGVADRLVELATKLKENDDRSYFFVKRCGLEAHASLIDYFRASVLKRAKLVDEAKRLRASLDRVVAHALGFTAADNERMEDDFNECFAPSSGPWSPEYLNGVSELGTEEVKAFAGELVGLAFGRFGTAYAAMAGEIVSRPGPLHQFPAAPPVLAASTIVPNGTGVLVDDPGHRSDLVNRCVEVLGRISSERFESALSELEAALGASDLRHYVRKRTDGLFQFHVGRYSPGRRKAPIYWQLATPSASYSVWCYYHRLTRDTFFRVANDYVAPKVDHEERKLNALRQEAGPDPSSKQRKAIDAQETFVAELRAFQAEVARIAPLWNPNLNDGVIINFAPLWRLVPHHKPWQKECKACWDKLCNEDYDWAHLAMHLWPERVVPKCQDDRSLAIAHGLEDEFWYQDDDGKWQRRQVSDDRIEALVTERASTAVKAALKDLLEAPAAAGQSRRKRRAKA